MNKVKALLTIFWCAAAVPNFVVAADRWKVLYREDFSRPIHIDSSAWVKDTLGPESPWYAGPLSDGGTFFYINGGEPFAKQLAGFSVYRQRITFGKENWLTLELEARDRANRGRPDEAPSLSTQIINGRTALVLAEPAHDGGILIRSSKPLPPAYRIEYDLVQVNFGGTRRGQWEYDGLSNGYRRNHPKTSHPWAWGPDPALGLPYEKWPDASGTNGFYYLAIVDYPNPAPHNNIFIHTHRKVVIDSYNVPGGGFDVCNPATKDYYRATDNSIDAFFAVPGTKLESRAVMKTECGTVYGGEGGRTGYVGAAQLMPELLPEQPCRFAIERDRTGYTIEFSGNFRFVGRRMFRYHRNFIEDGKPIWHFNQTPQEYDGAQDEEWIYQGPYGKFVEHSWPKGSAYPDYFIIGDPHINFYEGSAAIADLRLLIPAEP